MKHLTKKYFYLITNFFLLLFLATFPQTISAQNVTNTKFGMFYLLWHCPAVNYHSQYLGIPDVTEILAGNQIGAPGRDSAGWAPVPSFHYWGKPELGYYCLSQNDEVLRQHAGQLRDLGIDFVYIDATNTASTDKSITDPFDRLLQVWNIIPGAPKVVPWVPVNTDGDMVNYLTSKLQQYPNMQFIYQGKPLLLVTDNDGFKVDEARISQFSNNHTIRKMWGLYGTIAADHWSWLQRCGPGFKGSQGAEDCNQLISSYNGSLEQISVGAAYQNTFASHVSTAVPKFDGKTLQKQFQTIFNYSGIPIVMIDGWNEFIAQRFCLDSNGNAAWTNCTPQNDHWPDGNKIFVDSYNKDYNRDIEPAENDRSDIYYKITKACISLYKSGGRCDSSNASNLCCTLPTYIYGYVDQYQCDNTNWNIAGWATDNRDHSKKLTVRAEVYPDNEPYNKVNFTGVANISRPDLLGVCPPDGICSYGIKINSLPLSFKDKKLRAHVFGVTSDSEMELTMTQAPNNIFGPCNNLVSTSTSTPMLGDLNGDGKADIYDYNIIVRDFGHPYTIFDYNQLVENFGK